VLYLKVDDATRPEFESRGCKPFTPYGKQSKNYYELPADVLEAEDELRTWTRDAIGVARRAKK
jgi:DNA transformation protein